MRPTPISDVKGLAAGPSLIAPVTVRAVARIGWTIEHVEPLRDVLDQLTGEPNVIASHAATWHNMAVELRSMAEELEDLVAQTRRIVRDLGIDLMALAVPLPVSAAQMDGTLARWACRIAGSRGGAGHHPDPPRQAPERIALPMRGAPVAG